MKITDCSSASGPAGGLLTCWDKDVLAFCHWKIRAHWQGGNIWGEFAETEKITSAQLSTAFSLVRKKHRSRTPSSDQGSAWLQPSPVQEWRHCEPFMSDKWHPRWEPEAGEPQHRRSWLEKGKIHTALSSTTTSPRGFHLAAWISTAVFNKQGKKAAITPAPAPASLDVCLWDWGWEDSGSAWANSEETPSEESRERSGWFVFHFVS